MENTAVTADHDPLRLALDFVQCTGRHIFLTGKAGTGKTTFLQQLKTILPKRMVVVAPTGVAAVNAGGVTIHSFFQLPFGPHLPWTPASGQAAAAFRFGREKLRILRTLDLLVIDEISMVRADLLDGIDEVLRRFRDRGKPFGGVQLLMIGDLQQLAPVVKEEEWRLLAPHYDSPYFFASRALREAPPVCIELTHIHRQSDPVFIDILNQIRENRIDRQSLETLNRRYIPDFPAGDGYITLTTHNAQAQRINETRLRALPGPGRRFTAEVEGDFPDFQYPTEAELELKEGAQVMFVKNDASADKLYYNGKIGRVVRLEAEAVTVRCAEDPFEIRVERLEWHNAKYTIDEGNQQIREEIIGTFRQLPLKLAWAITIHKSQGLTFERAVIDAKAAFASGQVYVALSRCKSLEGLVLSAPIAAHNILADDALLSFTREIEEHPPDAALLREAQTAYQRELLWELFDFSAVQRRLGFCAKVWWEHSASIAGAEAFDFDRIREQLNGEVLDMNTRFRLQMERQLAQHADAETNPALQASLRKACPYFIEKLTGIVLRPLQECDPETDSKIVRKAVHDAVHKALQEVEMKIVSLQACGDGFTVKEYMQERARGFLRLQEEKPAQKARGRKEKVERPAGDAIPHPELFALLKQWRAEKATENGLLIYMVLAQKTLLDLVHFLPQTPEQLRRIKGIGKIKLQQYGEELLEIIVNYRRTHDLD